MVAGTRLTPIFRPRQPVLVQTPGSSRLTIATYGMARGWVEFWLICVAVIRSACRYCGTRLLPTSYQYVFWMLHPDWLPRLVAHPQPGGAEDSGADPVPRRVVVTDGQKGRAKDAGKPSLGAGECTPYRTVAPVYLRRFNNLDYSAAESGTAGLAARTSLQLPGPQTAQPRRRYDPGA